MESNRSERIRFSGSPARSIQKNDSEKIIPACRSGHRFRICRHIAANAAVFLAVILSLSGPALRTVSADEAHSQYAGSSEMAATKEVVKYGMTPITGDQVADGTYDVDVSSSSQFFNIENAKLTVKDGQMEAALTMSTYSYSLLYLGTAEEAAAAPASDYIEYEEIDYWYVFTIPVKALNQAIDCASFSDNRSKWYSRQILFDASSLPEEAFDFEVPDYDKIEDALEGNAAEVTDSADETSVDTLSDETKEYIEKYDLSADDPALESAETIRLDDLPDGEYSIALDMAGGSGRAYVSSPTLLTVKDGEAYARLLWSSNYYDWMIVGGKVYRNETTDGGNSSFTIPISGLDTNVPVIADTTAMGDPVPIDYTLAFYADSIGDKGLIPQEAAKKVILVAVIIIVGGFILNLVLKRKRKGQ